MPIDDEGAWQAQRIRNFEVNVEEANQQEDDAPPPVDVVIQRGLRGRLGGTAVATVGDWIEIARFIVPEPEPVVIQSAVGTMLNVVPGLPAAPIPPLNFSAPAFPRVMLRIRVGSGNQRGGSDRAEYFCVAGEMIAVSGTYITVDAQIFGDETAGNQPEQVGGIYFVTSDFQCPVTVTIAIGSPSSAENPTKWLNQKNIDQTDVSEQLFTGPGRIKQVHGYNAIGTATTILYLMLFDIYGANGGAIPTGNKPLFTIPVPGGSTPYFWDCVTSSRFFQLGLAYGISTTPGVYTPAEPFGTPLAGVFEVVTELYSCAMQTLTSQPNA